MFLLICKLYICIQNVFGHIFYSTRLHLYQQVWQFEVQKLAYMLILAAGGMIPYLSSVPPPRTPPLFKGTTLIHFLICLQDRNFHHHSTKLVFYKVECVSEILLETFRELSLIILCKSWSMRNSTFN